MKLLLQILLLTLTLASCGQSKIDRYKSIIDRTTSIKIEYIDYDKVLELERDQFEFFKEILKRNVEPEIQRKFKTDIKINLYENEDQIGYLMVTFNDSIPYVNFSSHELNFGFQLTYGIGQFLNEKLEKHTNSIRSVKSFSSDLCSKRH